MEGIVQTTENVLKGRVIYIPEIDKTLTKEGYSADAKEVGDRMKTIADAVNTLLIEGGGSATGVHYDNATSGLESDRVQGAIDEIVNVLKNLSSGMLAEVTALNNNTYKKSGGMIDGTLMVRNADNGYGSLMKNNSSTADYGTQFADVTKDGKVAKATVNASSNLFTFVDTEGNIRDIHHEGNKLFSNYGGNGSANSRVINTNGIGKLLFVYSSTHVALVTPKGALVVTLSGGNIEWMGSNVCYYVDGKLTLTTTNEAFNKSNTTYYYQVI